MHGATSSNCVGLDSIVSEDFVRFKVRLESSEQREVRLRGIAKTLINLETGKQKVGYFIKSVFSSLCVGIIIAALYMLLWIKVFGLFSDGFTEFVFYMFLAFIGSSSALYYAVKVRRSSCVTKIYVFGYGIYSLVQLIAICFTPLLIFGFAWISGVLLHCAFDWIPEYIFNLILPFLPLIQLIVIICGFIYWFILDNKIRRLKKTYEESLGSLELAELNLYANQIVDAAL